MKRESQNPLTGRRPQTAISHMLLPCAIGLFGTLLSPSAQAMPSAGAVPPSAQAASHHAASPTSQAAQTRVPPNSFFAPSAQTQSASESIASALVGVHNLTAQTLDGAPFDIAAQPGWKVVYFWSAACPCVTACEQYSFLPLVAKYAGKVQFYAVVSGKYDLDMPGPKLRANLAAHHLPYTVLLDSDHAVVTTLNGQVTPETFLLDPQNRIVFSGMPDDTRRYLARTGHSGGTQSYLGQALKQALAGKPITKPHTENQGCIIAW